MRLPICTSAVALLAATALATHMRAEEIALRSGLFSMFDDVVSVFKAADPPPLPHPAAGVDIPPIIKADPSQTVKVDPASAVKADPSPAVQVDPASAVKVDPPPAAKFGPPPEIMRPSNFPEGFPSSLDQLRARDFEIIYARDNQAYFFQEFKKLSKADQDMFNTRSLINGYPQVLLPPANVPSVKSIVDYNNLQMVYNYDKNRPYFLQEFKKLPSADQTKFNKKLQELKLGDPLIPNSPFAKTPITEMNPEDLNTLYRNDRAYFDQEVNALPDKLKDGFYREVRTLDEMKPPAVVRDPNSNSIPGDGMPKAIQADPPPAKKAKVDPPPAAKFNPPPVIERPSNFPEGFPSALDQLRARDLVVIYQPKNMPYFFQEFKKLSKAEQDVFNTKSILKGGPHVTLAPKNIPPGKSIVDYSDLELTSSFHGNRAYFLGQFKSLTPADKAKFNGKLQKLKLGDPLIPNSPFAMDANAKDIHFTKLKPPQLKTLYMNDRAYFEQEVNILPDALKRRFNGLARPLDEMSPPAAVRDPTIGDNGMPRVTKSVAFNRKTDFSPKEKPTPIPQSILE
jgi:hypothetical protein